MKRTEPDLSRTLPCCPVCNLNNGIAQKFNKNGCFIYSCSDCGLLFVFPQPEEKDLLAFYSESYFRRGNKYNPKIKSLSYDPNLQNDLMKMKLLNKYKSSGRLLDVGCAMGGFLKIANEQGFEVEGVEVAETAAQYVKQNLGIKVSNCDLPNANLGAESFDIITLWDVFEHLKNPNPVLAEVHRLLRPGGLVFISTGDASSLWARLSGRYWQLLTPSQHMFFYTPKSLRKILELNKFSVRKIIHSGKRATLDFILFKAHETFGPIIGPIRYLARAIKLDRLQIYMNLGDIMTCIVEKTDDVK